MKNKEIEANYLLVTKVVYYGIMATVILFAIVVWYLLQDLDPDDDGNAMGRLFYVLIPVLALFGFFLNRIVYEKMVDKMRHKSLTEQKNAYMVAVILSASVIEVPMLIGIVATFLTADFTFMWISSLLLIVFYLRRPTDERIREAFIESQQIEPQE